MGRFKAGKDRDTKHKCEGTQTCTNNKGFSQPTGRTRFVHTASLDGLHRQTSTALLKVMSDTQLCSLVTQESDCEQQQKLEMEATQVRPRGNRTVVWRVTFQVQFSACFHGLSGYRLTIYRNFSAPSPSSS